MKKVPLGRAVARVTPPMVICLLGAGGVVAAAQLSTGKLPPPAVPAVHFPAAPSATASGRHGPDTAPTTAGHPEPSASTTSTTAGSQPTQPSTSPGGIAPGSTVPTRTSPTTAAGGPEPGDDGGADSPATTVVPNYPVVTDPGSTPPSSSSTTQARDS